MADTDIVTLDDATTYLSAPNDGATIGALVEAISDRLDDLCGPIVIREYEETFDGTGNPNAIWSQVHAVVLQHCPVVSVTSITERMGTTTTTLDLETSTSQGTSSYVLNPKQGIVYRRTGGWDFWFPVGRQNITVTYDAGRFEDTESVSSRFKQAALITLAHHWQKEKGTGNAWALPDDDVILTQDGFAIPRRAWDLLGNERQPRYSMA